MKISVKMTARDLFLFSMYNSWFGATGILNLIFSVGALFLLIFTWGQNNMYQRALLIFCALVFTVVQPIMLHFKSQKQAEQIGFSTPINLTLTDEKIAVEQAGVEGDLTWNHVWKVIRLKSMFILKMGPAQGYLIPNRSIEGREDEFAAVLKRNLPEKKWKGAKL
ncbi:MAG: YcxB family protein [Lachnospiraceae bacterium]|jgi:hypothetical protein|nr:YcxB family protein [Lachnospiraceae bacterium]NBJ83602.1 YcxB family protein [bacterium 1XD42-76]NBK06886.1 YcxB family protein [bacterium 1XD42-94]